MKVAVVGCGYVGLVTGVGLASLGHDVTGIEVEPNRRDSIASGTAPFYEPGLPELLEGTLASGKFRVSGDLAEVQAADVVLLAVQTPPDGEGAIDLSFLHRAAEQVAQLFAAEPRRRVVAVRSTVVPGTTESLVAPLFAEGAAAGSSPTAVAANPEFLAEGTAVDDFTHADRVVVGCSSDWGREMLRELYGPLNSPIVMVPPTTAELAKYTSNAFLATLISFSNEIGRISETFPDVDVEDVLGIIHVDRRLSPKVGEQIISPKILSYIKAGCGYGGSCLPKDLSALRVSQARRGHTHPLLDAVQTINESQPGRVVAMAERAVGGLDGRRVTVLGVAFKAGTDDLRSSPGLTVVDELLERGAEVTVFDPLVSAAQLGARASSVRVADSLADAVEKAEVCVITTIDPAFRDLIKLLPEKDAPVVVDGRRILAVEDLDGSQVLAVGRGVPSA